MYSNYTSSDWFFDMQRLQDFCVSVLPWRLLTFAVVLLAISVISALLLCIWRSLFFDIATKDDIIQDRRHCPNSWYFGEDYEKVKLKPEIMRIYLLYANLSYHTFWNVVMMGRWRLCGEPYNHIYFRVNRFSENFLDPFVFFKRLFMLYSLSFVWGYLIFLLITSLRLLFCKKPLC